MTKNIRPIRIEGNTAYITLTQGYEAIIDVDDIPLVEKNNWCVLVWKSGGTQYAIRKSQEGVSLLLHRAIMNPPKGMSVDHINGNGLDNRRANLRIVTTKQNLYNQGKRKNNKSGYKGVSFHKGQRKWTARITVLRDGVNIRKNLGYFNTPEEAYIAYCALAKELHGEYANLG